MRKGLLWIALVAGVAFNTSAQSLTHKVVASNGGTFANTQATLSYTIGETIIPTFTSPNNILTQGFQQTNVLIGGENLVRNEVSTFEAFAEYRTTKLLWVTNTSAKTDFIVLERLDNTTGKFQTLEQQNSVPNKNDLVTYSFTDSEPQDGDNVYRVNQVFLDGKSNYSADRKVAFLSADKVSVFPNPADDQINIDVAAYQGKDVTIYILSELGQVKRTQTVEHVGKQPININIEDLQSGHYQVRIEVEGKRNVMKQFIISK